MGCMAPNAVHVLQEQKGAAASQPAPGWENVLTQIMGLGIRFT